MTGEERPQLISISGNATSTEVAAILAVLQAAGSGPAHRPEPNRSTWAAPARGIHPLPRPAPGAWQASGLPR